MKYIAILFLIYAAPLYACEDDFDKLLIHINKMIDNKQYEEAASYLAKRDKTNIAGGYRILAALINLNDNVKNKEQLKEKYLVKGCGLGDYNSCREHTNILVARGEYQKAEAILLKIVKKHSDPKSAGYLISLYHTRKWKGFNEEKAKYWQHKLSELY